MEIGCENWKTPLQFDVLTVLWLMIPVSAFENCIRLLPVHWHIITICFNIATNWIVLVIRMLFCTDAKIRKCNGTLKAIVCYAIEIELGNFCYFIVCIERKQSLFAIILYVGVLVVFCHRSCTLTANSFTNFQFHRRRTLLPVPTSVLLVQCLVFAVCTHTNSLNSLSRSFTTRNRFSWFQCNNEIKARISISSLRIANLLECLSGCRKCLESNWILKSIAYCLRLFRVLCWHSKAHSSHTKISSKSLFPSNSIPPNHAHKSILIDLPWNCEF